MNYCDTVVTSILSAMFAFVPTGLVSVAAYVLTSLSLYTIAARRQIANPWLSWIPVVRIWVLGSLSDQYRYVVKGQYKSKRKILIGLKIANALMAFFLIGQAVYSVINIIQVAACYNAQPDGILELILGNLATIVVMAVIWAVTKVIRYMALYDVYMSMDPSNGVLFSVLSIFFPITEPFFLLLNRDKDKGMPPRRQTTVES